MRCARGSRPSLLCLALCATSVAAFAQTTATDGAYTVRAFHDREQPGAIAVTSSRGGSWATLAARIPPTRALLVARDNGNSQFALGVDYARTGSCDEGVLRLGANAFAASSWGSSPEVCSFTFELTAPLATLAASVFRVTRQDRHPVAERVTGTFITPHASYRAGDTIEIVLTLLNPPGAPRVLRHAGGRQRGPRDNQFSFRITRDGVAVAPIEGWDFGGISSYTPLDPGDNAGVRATLDRWGDISVPGRYVVECTYETQFSPDGARPYDDAQRGAIWDRVFLGTVVFHVR